MKLRLVSAMLAAALAAGCKDPPGQYRMSAHDAYEKLRAADFKEFRNDRQCGILIHITNQPVKDKSVTWFVTSGGRTMLHFTARLVPVDAEHTQVVVDVAKEGNGREAYDGSQFYPRPAVMQPVRPAITEQIDAILTDRPFKWQNVRAASAPKSSSGTFAVGFNDSVCRVQRGGLEGSGRPFDVHDLKKTPY